MAEAWPLDIVPMSIDFRFQKNTRPLISPLTHTVQLLHLQGRRWVAQMMFRAIGRTAGQRLDSLLWKGETFLLWDFSRADPLNGTLAGVLLNGAALRGSTSIPVDGLPVSQTKLKAGDYVGIGGKLYGLEDDVAANGSGQGTLTLNRGLLAAVANDSPVTLTRPTCEMFLENDDQNSRPIDYRKIHDFTLSFLEVL